MPLITKSIVINNNAPVGCPPGGTEDQILAKNSNLNFDYKWVDAESVDTRPYKVYKALLTQSGTSIPVATILENTLGNITYTYDNSGAYYINSSSLFNLNKTFIIIGNTTNVSNEPCIVYSDQVDVNQILLQTYNIPQVAFENFILNETPILIEVYP